jgi:hypothetical protein
LTGLAGLAGFATVAAGFLASGLALAFTGVGFLAGAGAAFFASFATGLAGVLETDAFTDFAIMVFLTTGFLGVLALGLDVEGWVLAFVTGLATDFFAVFVAVLALAAGDGLAAGLTFVSLLGFVATAPLDFLAFFAGLFAVTTRLPTSIYLIPN